MGLFIAKARKPIAQDIAAEVMFASDRTCCVCRSAGKPVQIHHIDENPANNIEENLAVLCLECHDDTQLIGGFGRKLNAPLVSKYKTEWCASVARRRQQHENLLIEKTAKSSIGKEDSKIKGNASGKISHRDPLSFVNALPAFKKALLAEASKKLDTGVTQKMLEGSYEYIDALIGVLVELAKFYPEGHFSEGPIEIYFSEIVQREFQWQRAVAEPYGVGTGGTIVGPASAANVMACLERMVEDLATGLVGYDDSFDWKRWPIAWRDGP